MRYHSFEVAEAEETLPVTAVASDDGAIMSVEWPEEYLFGVQYHPESIGSPYGRQTLRNFVNRGSNHVIFID
jgi:anthranilate synthase component II